MSTARRTVARPITLEGTGLHLGIPCQLTFKPAPSGQGVGAKCKIDLGQAQCAEGLFCYPTSPTGGFCSPFCSGTSCSPTVACNEVFLNGVAFVYEVRVCVASAAGDAGG